MGDLLIDLLGFAAAICGAVVLRHAVLLLNAWAGNANVLRHLMEHKGDG